MFFACYLFLFFYIVTNEEILENKRLETKSIAEEIITMIAIHPVRTRYNFTLLCTLSDLFFKNIMDEK